MVAEVSSLARMVDGYKEEGEGKSELVTLDLLGGCCGDGGAATAAEVNLEFQIRTAGGEMRLAPSVRLVVRTLIDGAFLSLELSVCWGSIRRAPQSFHLISWWQSAKLCHQQTKKPSPASPHLHDLSLSPPWLSAASVGRKHPPAATSVAYNSVCTLEKVKSALERESRLAADARVPVAHLGSASSPSSSRSSLSSAPTTTITTNSSSAKRRPNEPDELNGEPAMAVVACPECLLYVLVCKVEPRCPRCAAHVPVNDANKKPRRIDLNFSFQTGSNE
ncbi:hypothetical protein ZIOFF_001022 [Zingiber officinale]|uniref:GIR1-like zinc ribbon domain-containing protein n=1 Tax=Zingiber officinale TaxID=94328 RepID=A0A8J5IJ47_ZINOF|nr:hypothetical protein ZIOFF_001022 [Zingiber officinale]